MPSPDVDFVLFQDEELGLAFRYPHGWALREQGKGVVIASDEALLNAATFDLSGAGMILETRPLPESTRSAPEAVMGAIVEELGLSGAPRYESGPDMMAIRGQPAIVATLEGAADEDGQTLFYYLAFIRGETQAALATGVTLPVYATRFQPLLEAVAATIELSEPVGPIIEGTLAFGEAVTGTVLTERSSAWRISGQQGASIDLVAKPLEQALDLTLDVKNEAGRSILGRVVDEAFGTESIRGLAIPETGNYLVIIGGFAGSSGTYALTMNETDALGTAAPLFAGDRLDGEIETDGFTDYTFTTAGESELTISVAPEGDLDVVVELIDPEQGVILEEDASFGREILSFQPLPGVEYTIRVRGFAGASGRFSIALSEGNRRAGSTLVARNLLVEGQGSHSYPFYAPEGETISAVFEPAGELDVIIDIWGESGSQLETVDSGPGSEAVAFSVPETGLYRFEVRGLNNGGGNYSVTLRGGPEVVFEITYDDVVDGLLGESAYLDYRIRLDPEERVLLTVANVPDMDPVLELYSIDGDFLQETDDGGTGVPETLILSAPAESEPETIYLLRVRDYHGDEAISFTLTVAPG